MEFVDYYQVMGLNKSATVEDVKKTYHKLARKLHPDLNPNDKQAMKKFQDLNDANEVLGDSEKRKKYDQYGKDWKNGADYEKTRQEQQNRYAGNGGGFGTGEYSDFFESMFGRRGGGQVKFRGQDVSGELKLSLKEAYTTQQKTFNVKGQNIRITIPAGFESGKKIKLAGNGGVGMNGGPNGDLYITITIADSGEFKRIGSDLIMAKEIDLFTAILGGDILIDTMDGKIKLKVPPETQTGTKIRAKGKGFPIFKKDGEFGDLLVSLNIKIPTNLSEKQKELFSELQALG